MNYVREQTSCRPKFCLTNNFRIHLNLLLFKYTFTTLLMCSILAILIITIKWIRCLRAKKEYATAQKSGNSTIIKWFDSYDTDTPFSLSTQFSSSHSYLYLIQHLHNTDLLYPCSCPYLSGRMLLLVPQYLCVWWGGLMRCTLLFPLQLPFQESSMSMDLHSGHSQSPSVSSMGPSKSAIYFCQLSWKIKFSTIPWF
jgi:hypothetical protein